MCWTLKSFAKLAHAHDVPLLIDNTFATPILCRPFAWGADIVIHSTTKYMDGHALQVGGVIVDSGNFPWDNGKFPGLSTPDESYHGIVYTESFGKAAYITKARVQLMRDLGCYPAAHSAFLLNLGLETLALRMERHCANAQKVAAYLESQEAVEFVNYPGLKVLNTILWHRNICQMAVVELFPFPLKGEGSAPLPLSIIYNSLLWKSM